MPGGRLSAARVQAHQKNSGAAHNRPPQAQKSNTSSFKNIALLAAAAAVGDGGARQSQNDAGEQQADATTWSHRRYACKRAHPLLALCLCLCRLHHARCACSHARTLCSLACMHAHIRVRIHVAKNQRALFRTHHGSWLQPYEEEVSADGGKDYSEQVRQAETHMCVYMYVCMCVCKCMCVCVCVICISALRAQRDICVD